MTRLFWKFFRILMALIIILVILVGLAVFGLNRHLQSDEPKVFDNISGFGNAIIQFESGEVDIWNIYPAGKITLRNLKLSDNSLQDSITDILVAKGIEINLSNSAWSDKTINLNTIVLDSAVVKLHRDQNNTYNFQKLKTEKPVKKESNWFKDAVSKWKVNTEEISVRLIESDLSFQDDFKNQSIHTSVKEGDVTISAKDGINAGLIDARLTDTEVSFKDNHKKQVLSASIKTGDVAINNTDEVNGGLINALLKEADVKFRDDSKDHSYHAFIESGDVIVFNKEKSNVKVLANIDSKVLDFTLKQDDGSYLQDANVNGNFELFLSDEGVIISPTSIRVNDETIQFSANLSKNQNIDSDFYFKNDSTVFSKIVPLLAPSLHDILKPFSANGDFRIEASLRPKPGFPLRVDIDYEFLGNDLEILGQVYKNTTLSGHFVNDRFYKEGDGIIRERGHIRFDIDEAQTNTLGAQIYMQDLLIKSRIKEGCLLYTSPSPRDGLLSRMPSSA